MNFFGSALTGCVLSFNIFVCSVYCQAELVSASDRTSGNVSFLRLWNLGEKSETDEETLLHNSRLEGMFADHKIMAICRVLLGGWQYSLKTREESEYPNSGAAAIPRGLAPTQYGPL